MKTYSFLILIFFLFLSNCTTIKQVPKVAPEEETTAAYYPEIEREFRAAWVATVANINWPSKPGLPVEEQKAEAIKLLDLLQSLNFNAVIFQARPQSDALYQSELEPWSYYLTGEQGKAPEPFYDPLEFWIEEAHKRGLELHAWLNPYRAHHVSGGPISEHSVVNKMPDLVVSLKSGYRWFDPAKKGTQDHSFNVVMDIVNRYNIDGIHFDDYFYPYPSYHDGDFPDDESWQKYLDNGGTLSRSDWRRENVNTFIKRLYKNISAEKPHVKFGLSPFGIWRPNNPSSIKGFDQYEQLYADARLWLNEGWIDYFSPQLYWTINRIPQSFPVLLGWWQRENKLQRHLWPGMSIARPDGEKGADETFNQIMITRGILPDSPGAIHWSIAPLINDTLLAKTLVQGPYKKQALIPASPWLDNTKPANPPVKTTMNNDSLKVTWTNAPKAGNYVIQFRYGDFWDYKILSRYQSEFELPLYFVHKIETKKENEMEAIELITLRLEEVIFSAASRTGIISNPLMIWPVQK